MSDSKEKDFKELLDNQYTWPADYLFKFIVTNEYKKELTAVFKGHKVIEKPSSKGKYISVTGRMMMHSADEVMATYEEAAKIETVISL